MKYYYNLNELFFYLNIYLNCNLLLRCKAEFSASLYSLFAQETFLIIINVENSCAAFFFFFQDFFDE